MTFIDEVADEIGRPDSERNPTWALFVRVRAVAKHHFPPTQSDNSNQCALKEAPAICAIESVSRAHADGLYTWRGTVWSMADIHHFITMAMPTERGEFADCAPCFSSVWKAWASVVVGPMMRSPYIIKLINSETMETRCLNYGVPPAGCRFRPKSARTGPILVWNSERIQSGVYRLEWQ